MAEKEQKESNPMAPAANGYGHSDEEAVANHSKAIRRKKYMKWCLYVVIFVIFQIGVITLFAMTIAKFRTPTFRVRSATFGNFDAPMTTNNPSFNVTMFAELGVKNTNFGHFRYQESTVDFYYKGQKVGEAYVSKARARLRSTRKFEVVVNLSSLNITGNSDLASDFRTGVVPLSSKSRLRGRVRIIVLLKKNKNANMDCTMSLFTQTRELRDIACE